MSDTKTEPETFPPRKTSNRSHKGHSQHTDVEWRWKGGLTVVPGRRRVRERTRFRDGLVSVESRQRDKGETEVFRRFIEIKFSSLLLNKTFYNGNLLLSISLNSREI